MIRPRQIYPNRPSAEHPAVAHLFSAPSSDDSKRSLRMVDSSSTVGFDPSAAEVEDGTLPPITPYDEIWYCGYPVRP